MPQIEVDAGDRFGLKKAKMVEWFIYLIRCADGTLYTGITTNVSRRFAEHQSDAKGKGAKYLRGRGPICLVYQKAVGSRSLAAKLESRIKKFSKKKKEALVAGAVDVQEII